MSDREQVISSGDFSRLRRLIYDETGIALGTGKQIMLEGRIRRRLKTLEIHSYREYCDYLFSDQGLQEELVHLIDAVTTNKTDFFREPRHFDFLVSQVLPEHIAGRESHRPFLLWSAGCSSGEEPYTLAMVLSEYGLTHPGFAFRILATDVSTTVLHKAALGVYSADAVRPVPQSLKVRYLMHGRKGNIDRVRVVPELRRVIDLRRLNFMDSDYGIQEKFDVIFCRNVIIYFDRPTQQSILERITQCLRPGGHLFMGHAETLHELDLPVKPVAPALYRRTNGRT
ncbi:MAG TPA: CheR family methyltransferase [Terracidiphilus sp.]|nr:CheR family methyltransferase [Terracidiphilus sp.]